MNHIQELLENAERAREEGKTHNKLAKDCFDAEKTYLMMYRIESVNRVLDFVRSEYRVGRVCDLEILLCHCQSKLNGNIDGTELTFDETYKGIPFRTERKED